MYQWISLSEEHFAFICRVEEAKVGTAHSSETLVYLYYTWHRIADLSQTLLYIVANYLNRFGFGCICKSLMLHISLYCPFFIQCHETST
jgi:hypothetical protein